MGRMELIVSAVFEGGGDQKCSIAHVCLHVGSNRLDSIGGVSSQQLQICTFPLETHFSVWFTFLLSHSRIT